MAISGVDSHFHHHVHNDYQQSVNQARTNNQQTKRADGDADHDAGNSPDARFTPSAASQGQSSEPNAGTYQVTQIQVFSAAALILLAQPGAATAGQTPAASSPTQITSGTDSATTVPTQGTTAASQAVPPIGSGAASQTISPTPDDSTAPVTSGTSTTSTQDPLNALNSALQSLGLTQQQIQAFDQVASFINSISPVAFADLSNQIQALAQQASSGSPASTAATNTSSATPTSATDAASSSTATPTVTSTVPPASALSTASQPTGTYQIEELSIRFSGIDVQGTTGSTNGSNGTSGTFDVSAFKLSIQEVNLTLSDGNGQTAQINTTAPPANSGTAAAQTSAPFTATAS